ncbi:probable alpha-aspartyl dipeptidase [Scaptodrosophila lebanonensis]|uniref:dipeptidase E n=1 Tax=Drosophila lebanonensis TaxID=7225 RepID=A0A6J2TYB8_DROLE|nr:probable alpha-aspartyl dipeptidase [Scaptodrosophila lebanonensis]XP_030381523.1 probable alpha-aspartyl dipeptidase [Scaptodrosophila lebanonensis]
MSARNILLLSSSRLHGYGYLEHARAQLEDLFKSKNVKTVLFVPYAGRNHDKYTETVRSALQPWGYAVEGLHNKVDKAQALRDAQAIFVGGGNTFVLLRTLYELNLVEPIRELVLERGLPYVGSSAGTNVATRSIHTTNDMPVAYPPSFEALALVPFNINPHYLETDANTNHKGETRDERIEEFVAYHKRPVLGLRESNFLRIQGDRATLLGTRAAKLFKADGAAEEYAPQADLSFLLQQ